MKVLALTRYGPLGASSRVRLLQAVGALAELGIDVDVRPLLSDAYVRSIYAGQSPSKALLVQSYARRLVDIRAEADVVWIEKELLPYVPGLVESALLAGRPYVVDYDDATFHTYDRHTNLSVRRLLGGKVDRLMRGAAAVVAGNSYLANRALHAGASRVEILPSVVDLDTYGPVVPPPDGPFTIGWIGSPGSERLLETVRDVLLAETESGARVVLVGASPSALSGVPHETWTWTEASETDSMRAFHVGIMPLADTPWERGKCGYKIIQCFGVGRPVVASPVGVNAEIIRPHASGFLASADDEWATAFKTLRDNPLRAQAMGMAGRTDVENQYSLASVTPRFADVLRSVVPTR